jgi:hypothetical protein
LRAHCSSVYMPAPSEFASLFTCSLVHYYMRPHAAICVLILRTSSQLSEACRYLLPLLSACCMCPHTTIYVSSYCYICVLILLYMCPHTAIYVSSYFYICVLILLYMCPHTENLEPAFGSLQVPPTSAICLLYVSSYYNICVLILLYMCPHTAIYVSSYCYICVLILRTSCTRILLCIRPHTTIYVSSYSEPRALVYYYVYASSYYYICFLILRTWGHLSV